MQSSGYVRVSRRVTDSSCEIRRRRSLSAWRSAQGVGRHAGGPRIESGENHKKKRRSPTGTQGSRSAHELRGAASSDEQHRAKSPRAQPHTYNNYL